MDRTVLVALLSALLVAGSLVGTAVGDAPALRPEQPSQLSGPSSPAQIDDDRSPEVRVLELDPPVRSDVRTQGVDVSTAAAIQRNAAGSAIDRTTLEVAFDRTDDDQERRELLFQAATDVEIAIADLRSEQREIRADYVNGTVAPGTYAQSRARANVRAEQLQKELELIQELSNRVPQFSMQSRIATLRAALITFSGPVSTQVQSSISGESSRTEVYLSVSPNGSTLSTIHDGQYTRETFRSDLWTPDETGLIGFDQVVARVEELYPKFNSSEASGGISTLGPDGTDLAPAGLYRIDIRYDTRTATAYLDGDTRNVFYEVQRSNIASIEPGPPMAESDNGTRLVVNRTYDGWPLRIATFDNSTGTPIDVPVVVGEVRYRTGSDGVVWALAPAGQTRVVAVGEGGNASLTAVPLSSSSVAVDRTGQGPSGKIQVTPRERSDDRSKRSEA